MNILIVCSDYPDLNGNMPMAYVHTRDRLYKSRGSDVDVINFNATSDYVIDDIKVHPQNWLTKERACEYDLVIFHAANLRRHWRLLMKFNKYFRKIVFFFHGHEVLKISEVYSKPYDFIQENRIKVTLQNIYDEFKFKVWNRTFNKLASKASFIFVSNWMRDEFVKWIKPSAELLEGRSYITYNCVGKIFEEESYKHDGEKKYDFITIRGNLDNSKYSIDIVNELAKRHPSLKFLLIGKGSFFNYYPKAPNIEWVEKTLRHNEIPRYMDLAKVALMPTRTDAQGVMMCEMAAYGMPIITSDIPVCHEVFGGFNGVAFIDNNNPAETDLAKLLESLQNSGEKNPRYYNSVIGNAEYDLLQRICNK